MTTHLEFIRWLKYYSVNLLSCFCNNKLWLPLKGCLAHTSRDDSWSLMSLGGISTTNRHGSYAALVFGAEGRFQMVLWAVVWLEKGQSCQLTHGSFLSLFSNTTWGAGLHKQDFLGPMWGKTTLKKRGQFRRFSWHPSKKGCGPNFYKNLPPKSIFTPCFWV